MLSRLMTAVIQAVLDSKVSFRGRRGLLRALSLFAAGRPLTSVYGVKLLNRLGDYTNYLALTGYPGDLVATEVGNLPPGAAFIDIGANQGVFTVLGGKRVGENGLVIAFEPNDAMQTVLRRNVALNNLTNVIVLDFALGSASGAGALQYRPEHSGASTVSQTGSIPVRILDFAAVEPLLRPFIGDRPIYVKIDVEGYEEMVLASLLTSDTAGRIEAIIIELVEEHLNRHGSSIARIVGFLNANGFLRTRPPPGIATCDAVFERRNPL